MKFRFFVFLIVVAFEKMLAAGTSDVLVADGDASGAKGRVRIHSVVTNGVEVRWFEEMVPMRDGVRLYTVGLLPPAGEKRPIVFEKTPCDNAQRLPEAFAWAWKNRGPFHEQPKSRVAHNAIVAGRSRLALPMVVGGHDKRKGRCC